jgi:MFS transporter, FSR family, fosmidomycin resistance protein
LAVIDAPLETSSSFDAPEVITVSSAHFVHDLYSSFLAPLLPVLIESFSLTKTAAGLLSIFYQWPSLLQPLIGHGGDRVNLKFLVIMAPALAAVLMTLLGIVPTYAILALLLIVAGLNSAGLHSIGPVIVGFFSKKKLGQGMSYWMVGGELARTLGPLLVVSAVTFLTPRGLPWLIIGGVAASTMLFFRLRGVTDYRPSRDTSSNWGEAYRNVRPILLPIAAVITFRALLFSSFTTFLPTYMTGAGNGLWLAGASLSVMEVAGVVGALTGGVISDRLGRRRVMAVMTLVAPLAVLLFLTVHGWLVFPLLLLIGLTLLSTTPVIMALVQERAKGSRALANGIYMALNFSITSLATLMAGMIGDRFGLNNAFLVGALLMLVGLPAVWLLPKDKM